MLKFFKNASDTNSEGFRRLGQVSTETKGYSLAFGADRERGKVHDH